MEKQIKLILLLCFFTQSLFSQQIKSTNPSDMQMVSVASKKQVLDTCVFKVHYKMLSVNDVELPDNKKENFMLLEIGNSISKFTDYQLWMADSLKDVYTEKNVSMEELINKLMPLMKGGTSLNIFKNYPDGKLTVTDRIPLSGTFKYVENIDEPEWNLSSGSLEVCGYNCNKATTSYRGRNYTAWYAPDIPVSDGPWKFSGLPGLILKIEDDLGHYSFECNAIEKTDDDAPIYMLESHYINTDKSGFLKALNDFNSNPASALENSGLIKSELPSHTRKARPYNPIELLD